MPDLHQLVHSKVDLIVLVSKIFCFIIILKTSILLVTLANSFKVDCLCTGPLKTSHIKQPKPHISAELKIYDY